MLVLLLLVLLLLLAAPSLYRTSRRDVQRYCFVSSCAASTSTFPAKELQCINGRHGYVCMGTYVGQQLKG